MTKVNFAANRKKAEEPGLLGGGSVWKPKEGANQIRIVSECLEHPSEFKDKETGKVKKTFRWLCSFSTAWTARLRPTTCRTPSTSD